MTHTHIAQNPDGHWSVSDDHGNLVTYTSHDAAQIVADSMELAFDIEDPISQAVARLTARGREMD